MSAHGDIAMRTKSGFAYETFGVGDTNIITCTCWCEASPVVQKLDNHWLRRLAQDHTLVVTNRRGLAGSSGHPSLKNEVEGLREVIDKIGTPAILLGGCEASAAPIQLAAQHPDHVRALIIVNGSARIIADEDYLGGDGDTFRASFEDIRHDWERFFRAFFTKLAPIPWTDLDTAFDTYRQFVSADALADFLEQFTMADVRADLERVAAPTLVAHSTDNEVIPVPQAQYLASHIPGTTLHLLQGARHHIQPSYNDELALAVNDFLLEGDGGRQSHVVE
jgi:pimeloyl-ACP methyl ester carboxylesterase